MADTNDNEDLATKKVFTTGEAAQVCRVSQQTIIRCFDSGRLNGFRVPGSRFRRIPRDELMRFMRENDIPVDALEPSVKRILIVDDDPAILGVFEELLSGDDRISIATARTGYDAGMLTESFGPHLIILDYMLPDINGDVVCRRVRERTDGQDINVLVVSGVVNRDEIAGLLRSGANGFIKKPFDIHELKAKVLQLIGLETENGSPR